MIVDPDYIQAERNKLFALWQEATAAASDDEEVIDPATFIYAHASQRFRDYIDEKKAMIKEAAKQGIRIG